MKQLIPAKPPQSLYKNCRVRILLINGMRVVVGFEFEFENPGGQLPLLGRTGQIN